ncbi:MAG: DUF5681 domain-containing protein [Terriglobales bacterium]
MADNHESGYRAGYRKPPMHTRFKKGESGNPKGRPKGSLNLATVLDRTLREQVVVNEGGQRKTVTKLEAAVKQVTNKAASGDLSASRQLFMLIDTVEQRSQEAATPITHLDAADQEVVQGMLKRFEDNFKGEANK